MQSSRHVIGEWDIMVNIEFAAACASSLLFCSNFVAGLICTIKSGCVDKVVWGHEFDMVESKKGILSSS